MKNILDEVKPFFPKAHIYKEEEIIIEPRNNIYFRIDDIKSDKEFKCKMIEWVSRPSVKGINRYWHDYIRRGFNSFFKKNWSIEDVTLIYTKLGCGVNRTLCLEFVESGCNLTKLRDNE